MPQYNGPEKPIFPTNNVTNKNFHENNTLNNIIYY